ncbi:choice-of-anchor J domain-containing protein, partial [Flavobacterium sp. D11R37]|uniref:choice-of-anchor J domain-containing protein n=1 Tax=Flavobacterium coralii TaxID=2838017 RepID=UPI001CA6B131
MKKITLMLFMSLMSFCAFAQLPLEGFEGTWPPTGWEIYNNGIGPAVTWAQSQAGNITQPPYAGTHAAYLNRENVATGIPEDWLVTPTFPVPANPQLRFFSRLTQALDDGSIYRVLITTNTANAGVFADYTLLEEWTELEINPVQTVYNEVVVPIPASFVG